SKRGMDSCMGGLRGRKPRDFNTEQEQEAGRLGLLDAPRRVAETRLPTHTDRSCMSNPYLPFADGCWRGRVMPGWEKTFSQLDAWLAQTPGESIVRLPCREVRWVSTEQGVAYVKSLYSGSESADVQKWVTSLKWLIRPSRALAIFNISNEMLREGFLCPRPLLAARHRSRWGWPTDVFISEECLDPTIAQLLLTAEQDLVSSLLTRTAEELHRFHQAGFIHGDCTPYNLALTAQNRLVLFDNDRTVRRPG